MPNCTPDGQPLPRRSALRTAGWIVLALLWGAVLWFTAPGCAGKSLTLFSPVTGKKVAEYRNTDAASAIQGLKASFAADGTFTVEADASKQDATAVPLRALDVVNAAVSKIPGPVP